jgi:site-specific recombinase XerD
MVLDTSPAVKQQPRLATPLDPIPLQNYIKEYLTNCIIEEKTGDTVSTYAFRLNDFLKCSTGITPMDLRVYFQGLMERNLAASTRNAYYRSLHTFFEWAVKDGKLEKNPLANIKAPRLPKKLPQPFSPDDLDRLLLITSGQRFTEVRNRAILLVFLDTALRLAELSALKRSDIDILTGHVLIMGKGAKQRGVRIGKSARKALNKYTSMRDDDLPALWLSEERRPMTRAGIKVTIDKLCLRAGIKGSPHKCRHTAAINYLRNGGSAFNLQILLGHSTLTMTRHYVSGLNSEDMMKEHVTASPVDNMNLNERRF